ncbi:MAG: 4Fe-4S dicluster domain-containing protein [Clostridia bacterium]|uniref:4Fe-4S dicluster domain-containing protein n=1 Tax=Desulfitibacter alkalitolerans TaxID=264641 RepID=UPI0006860CD9|nr:4Fe-4S dicluster domain-containing protein [Desulfitibacter alkalitolerans]MBS3968606.1 4Fe-4S dicluster domain-containing protein [Clostridia bacterium]
MKIKVEHEKCTGCKACMFACSMVNHRVGSYKFSRIKIDKDEAIELSRPIVCHQCEDAPCAETCPASALERNPVTGAIVLDEEKCSSCQLCIGSCPFEAIFMNDDTLKPMKCELCSGDPQCVKVCELPGAIQLDN